MIGGGPRLINPHERWRSQLVGAADPWISPLYAPPPAPTVRPRLRPFVLRCPNCIAPIDGDGAAEGTTTRCAYCGVPMKWEAVVPLTRDDHPMRYWADESPLSEPAPRTVEPPRASDFVRGIGPIQVGGNDTYTIELRPQMIFRPHKLWVDDYLAHGFAITDIRIGHRILTHGDETIPASACCHGEGLDIFNGATVHPGELLTIQIRNLTAAPANFHGVLRGTQIT